MPEIFKEYVETKLAARKEYVREFVKEFVLPENLDLAISIVEKYISAIPLSMSVFAGLVLDNAARESIRSYFALVFAYIIEPDNYLRKNVPDAIALMDDAYVLHSSLEIALSIVDEEKKSRIAEQLEELKPVFAMTPQIRAKIPPHVLAKQEVIINYLEKLLDVKAATKERSIYILPPG